VAEFHQEKIILKNGMAKLWGGFAGTIGLERRFRHAAKHRVLRLDQRLGTYPQNAQSLSSRCDEMARKNISAP
jgi:hypothetical protein